MPTNTPNPIPGRTAKMGPGRAPAAQRKVALHAQALVSGQNEDPLFDETAAGAYLGGNEPFSVGTLRRWRGDGTGPPFIKMSRFVRYRKSDLDGFMASRCRRSTAEAAE